MGPLLDEPPETSAAGGLIAFVDRKSESRALSEALRNHRRAIDGDDIDGTVLRNVLTFYGHGGAGKTELSLRLSRWVRGELPNTDAWGRSPTTKVHGSAHWNVNDSTGGLDVVPLLTELRSAVGRFQDTWDAFDLALAAFLRGLRPGQDFELQTASGGSRTMGEVIAGIMTDAAGAAEVLAPSGLAAGGVGLAKSILLGIRTSRRAAKTAADFPMLSDVIRECESGHVTDGEAQTLLAGKVVWQLSRQIASFDPVSRPLFVVFVDHFERLQGSGRRQGETLVNELAARLPFCLFVITGRNALRWHESGETHLNHHGPQVWTNLSLDVAPEPAEPRQHSLGNLSPVDAEHLLEVELSRRDCVVAPGVIHSLATTTSGFPLHLSAIIDVATERKHAGALSLEDLGGPLPRVVDRLLEDLPPDEAAAFRAACLMPYFDRDLVASVAGAEQGAVERLLKRSLVQPNPSSRYPYKVHDRIRELVRRSGADASHGWAPADWKAKALVAIGFAQSRYQAAAGASPVDDDGMLDALALAINLCAEHSVYNQWLLQGLRNSPSLKRLAARIPSDLTAINDPEAAAVVDYVQLHSLLHSTETASGFRRLFDQRRHIWPSAGLWAAYSLRALGRYDEAIAQLEELLAAGGDRPAVYHSQIVTTLVLARRFKDALARMEPLTEAARAQVSATIHMRHGHVEGSSAILLKRIQAHTSRRFQGELYGDWIVRVDRERGATDEELREAAFHAESTMHTTALSNVAKVRGIRAVHSDSKFDEYYEQILELNGDRERTLLALPEVLALRGWAIGNDDLVAEAAEITRNRPHRTSAWIPLECLLEGLGQPTASPLVQWLEPHQMIRERWMGIFAAQIARAERFS